MWPAVSRVADGQGWCVWLGWDSALRHYQVKNAFTLCSVLYTALAHCQQWEEQWSGDGEWCEPQINLWLQTVTAAHARPQRHYLAPPWCYANVNSCHFWSRRHCTFRQRGDRRLLKATVHVCVFNYHTLCGVENNKDGRNNKQEGAKKMKKKTPAQSEQELLKDQYLSSGDVRCISRCSPITSTLYRCGKKLTCTPAQACWL